MNVNRAVLIISDFKSHSPSDGLDFPEPSVAIGPVNIVEALEVLFQATDEDGNDRLCPPFQCR